MTIFFPAGKNGKNEDKKKKKQRLFVRGKVTITAYIFQILDITQFDSKNLLMSGQGHSLTTNKAFQILDIIKTKRLAKSG